MQKQQQQQKLYFEVYIILHSEFYSNFYDYLVCQMGIYFYFSKNQTVINIILSIRSGTLFLILVFPEGTHRRKCNDDINYLYCDKKFHTNFSYNINNFR